MFPATLFRVDKTREQRKCPSTDIRERSCGTCVPWNTTQPQDEVLPFAATWVDLENTTLSETSQMEKVKNHPISLICGTKLKVTNGQTRQTANK